MTDNPTTQALARQSEAPAQTLDQVVINMRPQMMQALPKHLDADRMARIALTMLRKDKLAGGHLAECTPESFVGALIMASVLGLEPGVNAEAYLVPYKNKRNRNRYECQLIVGYQGMAKLYFQHPLAQTLDAQAVYEHDEFEYWYGTSPGLKHKPARGHSRGKVTEYYATATLATGASAFVVLTPDEVKELRNGKVGPSGDIADPMRWMERKTAIRQLLKLLPKSATLQRALESDETPGGELHTQLVVERDLPPLDARPDVPPDDPDSGQATPAVAPGVTVAGSDLTPPAAESGPATPDPLEVLPEPPADWQPSQGTMVVDPEVIAEAAPEPMNPAQRPMLTALFVKFGVKDTASRVRILTEMLDRPVAEISDLTKDEAKAAIDTLEAMTPESFAAYFTAPATES